MRINRVGDKNGIHYVRRGLQKLTDKKVKEYVHDLFNERFSSIEGLMLAKKKNGCRNFVHMFKQSLTFFVVINSNTSSITTMRTLLGLNALYTLYI